MRNCDLPLKLQLKCAECGHTFLAKTYAKKLCDECFPQRNRERALDYYYKNRSKCQQQAQDRKQLQRDKKRAQWRKDQNNRRAYLRAKPPKRASLNPIHLQNMLVEKILSNWEKLVI